MTGENGGQNANTLAGGLKTSTGRTPLGGLKAPGDGNESVNAALGPVARSVSSLELWLSALLHQQPWNFDESCIPMPWDTTQAGKSEKKLVVGVIWDDGVVFPTPPATVSSFAPSTSPIVRSIVTKSGT